MRLGIERLGPADLMFLALQSSTVVPNQFGAILVLDTGDGFDVAQANQVLADRVRSIPRLRQRVLRVPLGCGRPVWVDDGRFTLARHVAHLVCPAPGDERAMLDERIMQSRLGSVPSAAALTLASLGVRAAVALGVYDWYMRRQRYLHTVLANVHGPRQRQSLCGAPITQVVPLAVGEGGNVTVTLAALSYAGTLTVTVTVDPGVVPDLTVVADALQSELDAWTGQRKGATADAARAT